MIGAGVSGVIDEAGSRVSPEVSTGIWKSSSPTDTRADSPAKELRNPLGAGRKDSFVADGSRMSTISESGSESRGVDSPSAKGIKATFSFSSYRYERAATVWCRDQRPPDKRSRAPIKSKVTPSRLGRRLRRNLESDESRILMST